MNRFARFADNFANHISRHLNSAQHKLEHVTRLLGCFSRIRVHLKNIYCSKFFTLKMQTPVSLRDSSIMMSSIPKLATSIYTKLKTVPSIARALDIFEPCAPMARPISSEATVNSSTCFVEMSEVWSMRLAKKVQISSS